VARKVIRAPPVPKEARRFMALLLLAQKSEHDCLWKKYFEDMGNEWMKEYMPEEEGDG